MISYKVLAKNLFLWAIVALIALKSFGLLEIKLPKHKAAVTPVQEYPQPLMTGFELAKYENGKKKAVINAEHLYLRDGNIFPYSHLRITTRKSTELENVELTFFESDNPISCIVSRYADMDMKSKNLIFRGEPMLITSDRNILRAESIFWDNSKHAVVAEGNCSVIVNGKSWSAETITTDPELSNYI